MLPTYYPIFLPGKCRCPLNIVVKERSQDPDCPLDPGLRVVASSKFTRQIRLTGFTLIEILVSIAIIAVLAAILFPVFKYAKRNSYETVEEAQLRQLYVAVNLYEADYDQHSPYSLALLVPSYCNPRMLECPHDLRNGLHFPSWPANPGITIKPFGNPPIGDPDYLRLERAPFINSYYYLRTFVGRFPPGLRYSDYRNNPNVGLIAGLGLMTCSATGLGTTPGTCVYNHKYPLVSPGQPAENLRGVYLTVRTDGSIVTRLYPVVCSSDIPFDVMWLFQPVNCTATSVTSP